jgi:hypothetical protein
MSPFSHTTSGSQPALLSRISVSALRSRTDWIFSCHHAALAFGWW